MNSLNNMKKENFPTAPLKNIEQDKQAERLQNTDKVFDFLNLKDGERVLFLTDNNPYYTDRGLIDLLKSGLESRGIEFTEFELDEKKTTKEELLKAIDGYAVVWNSCGWEDTKIDFYKIADALTERGGRMSYSPGLKAEDLDNGGIMAEDKDEMDRTLNRIEAKLKNAAGFHITSVYGTDLRVAMKPGERRWFRETGDLKPGKWDNLPGGEVFTTPDEDRVDGVLVLPVLQDEVTKDQGVDKFVYLTIRGGKIAKIDGGKSAEKLRKYLQKESKRQDNPLSVLQCSEVAFGANSKGKNAVRAEEGKYTDASNPTVVTEKKLGTMHIAFGSSKHGEEGTEGRTESEVHLDFVLPRNGLTVTAFYSTDDFEKLKNGKRLIDEGRIGKLLE